MDDLSKLLREARPLYFARRRRRRAAAFSGILAACTVIWAFSGSFNRTPPFYDLWTEQMYLTENASIIEDMGLPVDDYGLLMVG